MMKAHQEQDQKRRKERLPSSQQRIQAQPKDSCGRCSESDTSSSVYVEQAYLQMMLRSRDCRLCAEQVAIERQASHRIELHFD